METTTERKPKYPKQVVRIVFEYTNKTVPNKYKEIKYTSHTTGKTMTIEEMNPAHCKNAFAWLIWHLQQGYIAAMDEYNIVRFY